jgi:uncharacterized protein
MANSGMIKCPTCKKEGRWFEGQYGAFCSRRCKLIDLAKWFGEEHSISDPLPADQFAESESQQSGAKANENEE